MNKTLKQQLREEYLAKLKNLKQIVKKQWDEEILQKFINSDYFKQHYVFAVYWSLEHEVNTHEIIKILLQYNKKVCLPRIEGKEIVFYYITSVEQLIIDNKYNIAQPFTTNEKVNTLDIEVVLVPIVAFDYKNNRLGYGGGFYDRFLANKINIISIGLAYKMQSISNKNYLPDSWDKTLFAILTNK